MFVAEILKFLFSFHVCFSTFYVMLPSACRTQKHKKETFFFVHFILILVCKKMPCLECNCFLENLDSP